MHLLFTIQLRIQTCYCPVSPEINKLLTYLLSLGGSIGMSSGGERGIHLLNGTIRGRGRRFILREGKEQINVRRGSSGGKEQIVYTSS